MITPDDARRPETWTGVVPDVVAALARRHRDFAACEDAVQDALVEASLSWARSGVPTDRRAWLIRVAHRRLIDRWRSERSRSGRELAYAERAARLAAAGPVPDDAIAVFLLCCHPALSVPSRVALTLRAVGGLTTDQIARAFGVPSATIGQRISRAKATLAAAGVGLDDHPRHDDPIRRAERLDAVRATIYLAFNEGYATTQGRDLIDVSLSAEAIRIAGLLHEREPEPETAGLLALLLFLDARRTSRVDDRGDLVPLADQDRTRWDRDQIERGSRLLTAALAEGPPGPYQVQAAIAATHAEAVTWAATNWTEITMLYRVLARMSPGPLVELNLAVAVSMAHGAAAGLAHADRIAEPDRAGLGHRWWAVRAHLLEPLGRLGDAAAAYREAARTTRSVPEQRYLNRRLRALET